MNGAVERCNGAWRYEFYAVYDLPRSVEALNPILDGFQHLYNHHRPHGAVGGITPSQYFKRRTAKETHPSHMSTTERVLSPTRLKSHNHCTELLVSCWFA